MLGGPGTEWGAGSALMGSYFTSLLERPWFSGVCCSWAVSDPAPSWRGGAPPGWLVWSCGCRGLRVLGALQFFGFIGRPGYGGQPWGPLQTPPLRTTVFWDSGSPHLAQQASTALPHTPAPGWAGWGWFVLESDDQVFTALHRRVNGVWRDLQLRVVTVCPKVSGGN